MLGTKANINTNLWCQTLNLQEKICSLCTKRRGLAHAQGGRGGGYILRSMDTDMRRDDTTILEKLEHGMVEI
jgi:hypothetical protein